MQPDNPWFSWQNPSAPSAAAGTAPEREPVDLVHEYVTRLNQVIARAREGAVEQALDQLERVAKPPREDLGAPTILDWKRRELLEQFNLLRHELCFLPDVGFDTWLEFFFDSADLAGSPAVVVTWDEPPPGHPCQERVPVDAGARYRARLREQGAALEAVRELSHIRPDGRVHVGLDAHCHCLTLSGAPFFFEHAKRALDRLTGEAPMSCTLQYDHSRDVQEGMLLPVRLQLRNLSADYMVLEELASNHPFDPREVFNRPSVGRLVYDQALDRYTYQTVAPGVTGTPFHTGVLRPGEERTVSLHLKMLEGGDAWRDLNLRYRRFSEAEFIERAYVPVPEPGDHFPPNIVYARLAGVPQRDRLDLSTVVFAPASSDPPETESHWTFLFHVGRRAFSLAAARARLPEGGDPVHFSRWQQAWVLRTADGCALVTQSRVMPYPRVQPEAFVLIDEAEQRVPVRFAEEWVSTFKALPLGIADWESHPMGLSVSLPKLKLTSFFHEIERLGCSLGLAKNMLGRSTLFVGPAEG